MCSSDLLLHVEGLGPHSLDVAAAAEDYQRGGVGDHILGAQLHIGCSWGWRPGCEGWGDTAPHWLLQEGRAEGTGGQGVRCGGTQLHIGCRAAQRVLGVMGGRWEAHRGPGWWPSWTQAAVPSIASLAAQPSPWGLGYQHRHGVPASQWGTSQQLHGWYHPVPPSLAMGYQHR